MKKISSKTKSNQKAKRISKGTNRGTSGMQVEHYANLWMRGIK